MKNPHNGAVLLTVGSTSYTLRFSIDALVRLEEASGMVLSELLDEMSDKKKISVGRTRQLLHAGLGEHHPGIDVKAAGELMLEAGGVLTVMAKITEALLLAFPEASGTPRPPSAPAAPKPNRAARRKAGSGRTS